MVSRKTSKREVVKAGKRRQLVVAAMVVVLVLAVLWLSWMLVFKINAYTPDKEVVKSEAQRLLNAVSLKGAEVYSVFTDQGCKSSGVGIRIDTNCQFVGFKYYKSGDPLPQTLKAADAQIGDLGWQRTFTSQSEVELDYILGEDNRQTVSYRNDKDFRGMVASLGYYKDSVNYSDREVQNLIDEGKLQSPADGEYIYGLRVGASYWSCNWDSIFKICPFPPSGANPQVRANN